ncbi:MAG: acyl-CoA dehydrogenase family protein [Deltaproteobacteria bacterium]|jgi:acyl-CoA dehydrogenase|nr:acyl-CoA dehydrogenase family protein [Deltaproteobacteria bacterium]
MRRSDTPEEADFRREVRSWLEANARLRTGGASDWSLGPADASDEAERAYWEKMKAWQRAKYDGGWAAITWPVEQGGRGGTPAQQLIFNEEQANFDVTTGYIDAAVGLIGPALIRFGTDEQRARYLKPMLRGDEIWCQLFSEPDAGSDLAAVRTRGRVEGSELVIDGQKVWTTSAQHADFGFILVRTDPEVPKHRGISFALVDMRQPGVEVRPLLTMKGDRHFNEVFFENVRTPLSNVVNGLDQGWPVATFVLMSEGAHIGTTNLGRTRTLDIARMAVETGRFEDPVVRQRIGETFVEERVLELLQDRLRSAILDGRQPDVDGSVLKILWAEGGHRKAETASWVQGVDGMLAGRDAPASGLWQSQLLSRASGTVGGGTSEVHRNGLGERALGLPREPRLDRDLPFKELRTSGD